MAEFRELLRTAPHKATGEQLRQQRIAAGLTLHAAAKRIGLAPSELSRVEQGLVKLTDQQAAALALVYDLDVPAKEHL